MSPSTTAAPSTAPRAEAAEPRPARSRTNIRGYSMILALLGLVILFEVLTGGLFLQPRNVTSLLVQNGYVLILAIGMVMVIIMGHIDLSVGSVAAFVGATVALLMSTYHVAWPLAILIGLALGALVGAWHGFWVAYVGIPAFIVTLAGMMLFRGLDLLMLNAQSIPVPEGFQVIANGYIPDMGPNTGYHNPTLVIVALAVATLVWLELRRLAALRRYDMPMPSRAATILKLVLQAAAVIAVGLLLASYKGIPVVGLIVAALVIVYTFITQKTVFGRHTYAVGGNRNAARLSGVDTRRQDFLVMLNMSVLAAMAGMVFTAYLNAANPKDGTNFELDAIAACFIGGAAVAGGVGTVTGAMIGALVMGVLNLGLANLSVDQNFVQIIKGLVLLLAVAFDVRSKVAGRPSLIGHLMNRGRGGETGLAGAGAAAPAAGGGVAVAGSTPGGAASAVDAVPAAPNDLSPGALDPAAPDQRPDIDPAAMPDDMVVIETPEARAQADPPTRP